MKNQAAARAEILKQNTQVARVVRFLANPRMQDFGFDKQTLDSSRFHRIGWTARGGAVWKSFPNCPVFRIPHTAVRLSLAAKTFHLVFELVTVAARKPSALLIELEP
jgi:hypothetical protein